MSLRGDIKLIHGDCMEAMKDMEDNQFDLALVDPPYGIGVNKMTLGSGKYKSDKKWDNNTPTKEYYNELKRVSKNQIIWGGNHLGNMPPSSCWVFWNKKNGTSDFADGELAYTSFKSPVRMFSYHLSQQSKTDIKCRFHPTQKPVQLYKWLLQNYAKEGDKILDTHGGSMSIAIACWDLGLDLDLYEIDDEYFNNGKARLERHQAQGQLF